MKVSSILQQPDTSSSKNETDMRLTQKRKVQESSCGILVIFMNGYKARKSKLKYSRLPLELRQFILENHLSALSWSNTLWEWSTKDQKDFPFSKKEWLELCQVYNEVTALKRLLQFFHQTKKQKCKSH